MTGNAGDNAKSKWNWYDRDHDKAWEISIGVALGLIIIVALFGGF